MAPSTLAQVMLPNDARLRNMTYSAPLTVDVTVTARTYSPEAGDYTSDTKKMTGVSLGRIPIMVRSRYCMLGQQSVASEHDECRFDYGGYFIINGNEKVVISQDRIAENRTFVFVNTKASCYSHVAEIRSVQEARFGVPKTTTLKLSSRANQFGRTIRVAMHHVKHDVPICVVFRALGVLSDREIAEHVDIFSNASADLDTPSSSGSGPGGGSGGRRLADEMAACMDEACHVKTQQAALEYMVQHMPTHASARDPNSGTLSAKIATLKNVLRKDFLPHVGTEPHKKALYLGYMAAKLLRTHLKLRPLDDRDSYINKRLDTPGVLLANLFRQYYGKVRSAPLPNAPCCPLLQKKLLEASIHV